MTAKKGFMAVHDAVRNHPDWAQLAKHVHELAFLDGGNDSAFTLASGRQSRWFFDTKPVMMHPEAASIMGRLLNCESTRWERNSLGAWNWVPCR